MASLVELSPAYVQTTAVVAGGYGRIEATFAWVQCSLEFHMPMGIWRRMWGRGQYQVVRMNTQRIFRVPTADEYVYGRPVLSEPA